MKDVWVITTPDRQNAGKSVVVGVVFDEDLAKWLESETPLTEERIWNVHHDVILGKLYAIEKKPWKEKEEDE